ncbi:transposase [Streptomyces sp. NPDC048385]|uniref:transposase n=1 Tax=unclassified Streptomyces TaxID=2593676 RepID=UPI003431CFDF
MITLRGACDLTSGQWARLWPLSPKGIKPGRPPVWTRWQLTDGTRCRARTGARWRDVAERYGPWHRVYDLVPHRQRDGTWARFVSQLQAQADAKDLIAWDVNVDSTVCRAHQHAAGASKQGICRRSRPAALPSSPPPTASNARQEGCPPIFISLSRRPSRSLPAASDRQNLGSRGGRPRSSTRPTTASGMPSSAG